MMIAGEALKSKFFKASLSLSGSDFYSFIVVSLPS